MKESKKAVLNILKQENSKDRKFESLVLNLALQKIDSDSFEYDGKAVYTSDKSCLVFCLVNDESFAIPEGVRVIGEMAFRQKKHLKNVIIPSTVETIERDAFYDCDDLDHVYIPASVETIRSYAFAECDKLRSVIFAGVPKHLSRHSFSESDDLHNVVVPAGTVGTFRTALHLSDGDMDFIVVEDPNNTAYLKPKKTASAGERTENAKDGSKADKQKQSGREARKQNAASEDGAGEALAGRPKEKKTDKKAAKDGKKTKKQDKKAKKNDKPTASEANPAGQPAEAGKSALKATPNNK